MQSQSARPQVYIPYVLCLLSALWGLYCLHGRMLADGFNYVHGDFGDGRLNALFLEHGYQYLFGEPWFKDFWAAAWLYYPFPKTMALSDVMIGSMPLYAPWRWLGFDLLTAYQLWFIAVSLANFATSFIAARMLKINILGATACAFVFSFSLPLSGFSNHPQLLPRFSCILTLIFLMKTYQSKIPPRKTAYAILTGLCFAWQFWISFYPAWYFMFILSVLGIVVLALDTRWLMQTLFTNKIYIFVALGVSLLLLFPLARQYLSIQAMIGRRPWDEIQMYLPDFRAYLSAFDHSPYYRLLAKFNLHKSPAYSEKLMFPGLMPIFALIALIPAIKNHSKTAARMPLALVCIATMLVLMLLPIKWAQNIFDGFSPWYYVYKFYPGAGAIRVTGRIVVMTIFIWGLILGILIDYLSPIPTRLARLSKWCLFAGMLVESYVPLNQYRFSKVDNERRVNVLVDKIAMLQSQGKNCQVFHNRIFNGAPHELELDAMWVSMLLKIPTTNGYSGMPPPLYKQLKLDNMDIPPLSDLSAWIQAEGQTIPEGQICILQ